MRITVSMVVVVLATCALLVGAACGGEQGNEGSRSPETGEATSARTSLEETTTSPEAEATEPPTARAGTTEAEAPETGEAGGAGEAREVIVVRIAGLEYEPSVVEVAPGTTVRWVNDDPADHTVTSEEAGGPLASEVFNAGGSFEYTFEEPGEFAYFCEVHPFMKGMVVVG